MVCSWQATVIRPDSRARAVVEGMKTEASRIIMIIQNKGLVALFISLLGFSLFTLPLSATGTYTLTVTPSTITIPQNGQGMLTVTTTASGGFNSPINLSASGMPMGVTASFNPTTIGAPGTGSSVMTITVVNIARTGTYPITVTGNGGGVQQKATVTLIVSAQSKGSFTLSAAPSSLSVAQGQQGTSGIYVVIGSGFGSSVSLSASGMPSGTTVSFNPQTIPAPGDGISTMTINVGGSTTPGTYPITVTGNGGGIQQQATVMLTVTAGPSFSISASPSSLTVQQGNQGTSTITTAISGGFNSSIALSASGVPTGTTVNFNPNPIPAPGNGNSTMTITVGSNTPTGVYPITVTGNGGGIQQQTTVTLTVTAGASFSISASPSSLTVQQGNQGTSTITTAISGGFNSSIALSASGVPTGTTVNFNPNPIPAPGNGNSTMTITVGSNTPTGVYPITVTGNGGGIQQQTTVTLTVTAGASFSISASPSSLTVQQGNQGTSTITTAISGGFNSSIALSASGVPTGTTVNFNPNPIPAPGNGNSTMTITVGSNTPTGVYPITVTGNGGGIQQQTTVTLTVITAGKNFTISASPSSLTIPQGNQGTSTITTTISGGFNSSITLSTSGVPSGTTVNFSPNPIPAPGNGNSGMTIKVGSGTPTGTYPITVTGNGGGVQQQTTVTLIVTQGNFTISASPSSLTIAQGNQGTSTITTAVSGGFNYSIDLSTSGAPSGTTVTLNPTTIGAPGNGNSTMTITVGSGTPLGTYPIIVTGNGGGIQQQTTVTLVVISPGNFTIAASPSSLTIPQGNQNSSTITTTVSGGFNNPINLTTSGVPSGTTVSFSPNPIPAPGSGNSGMTIRVGSNTPTGTYPITVTGSGGGIQQQTTVTLIVTQGSFTLSASPASLTIAQGNQGTSTITSTISGGFNNPVSLSTSGAPSGTTITLNPQTIPSPGSGNSVMTITVGSNTPMGTYPIIVTGNGGGIQQQTTVTLIVISPGNFTIAASPSSLTIPQGNQSTSTITTTISGGFNNPINLTTSGVPSGTTVSFSPNPIPAPGSGNSGMTITVGGGTPTGTYPITVTGSGGGIQQQTTVTLIVTQGGFTISASPASLTIAQGNQGTSTITTAVSGGFNYSIDLSTSGAPSGTTVTLNPTTIGAPGNGNSTMTITVGSGTPLGTYPIIVTGNGGGIQQQTTVTLVVISPGNFTIAASPSSLTIPEGNQGSSTITTTVSGGFNNPINLTTSGVPSGTTVSFSPNPIRAPGLGHSGMTVTVGSNTPTGTYPITVTGSGGGIQQQTTVTLIVTQGGFTLSASPASLTIAQGNQGTSTITSTISGGFNNPVSLSTSGAPSGTTITLNPQTIPSPGSGNSVMTITVGSGTPLGTYPIIVTGNGGGVQQQTTVTLIVTSPGNFTIAASPSSLTIPQGNQDVSTITTTVSGGFNNPINLTTSGVPSGTTVNFSPNPIPAPGSGSSAMRITVGSNTPVGTYPITVTGSGGGIQQQTVVTLTVTTGTFTITASPSLLSIAQGNQGTSTITTTVVGGFNSSIALSYSGAPSGTTVTLNPTTIGAPGNGNSTMTITVGSGTAQGIYSIIVTGNGGGIQQQTTVTLTVTSPGNFTISASPSVLTIAQGNQGTSTITTTVSGGFNNPINLSSSGAPSGTTISFNPSTIGAPGNGSSTMTITVGNSTPTGNYPITVIGIGGGIQQNTTVNLTVISQGQSGFVISAIPASLTLALGNQSYSTITTTINGGFDNSIALSYSGAPSGTTITLNPQTIPAPGNGSSTMTIAVGNNTPVGTYPIIVTGNGGGVQQQTTVTLTVTASNGEPFPTPPQVYVDTTWNPPSGGNTWYVHNSSDLTAALANFSPGDTIILDAGVVYSGNFVIPYRSNPNKKWTYIETGNLNNLPPPGSRVGPGNAGDMPKIVTPNQTPAIMLCSTVNSYCPASGTNYIRLVGIEVYTASNAGGGGCTYQQCNNWSWYLIQALSPDDGTTPTPADHITIDRSYIHGSPTQDVLHGIGAEGTYFAVIDSYISDIHRSGTDSQGILAYYTPGPIKITDNYVSATTEDVMFGGAGACLYSGCPPPNGSDNPYVPSDIEIRYNHFYKPLSWFSCGDGGTVPPGSLLADGTMCGASPPNETNEWVTKDNLEFKSAQRVVITGNTLENNWKAGQQGFSLVLTPRAGQSGSHTVVDDILFQSNIITNATSGINTLEADDGCGPPNYPYCTNPGEARRIYIDNNLLLLRNSGDTNEHFGISISAGGVDAGGQPFPGLTDFIVQHNTMLMSDYSPPFATWYFNIQAGDGCPPSEPSQTHNAWILDNAITRQVSGDCNLLGTYGLGYYMSDPSPLNPRFYGNVMWVPSGDYVASWPGSSNDATTNPFTYVDPGSGNFQLLIPDWTNTTDGNVSGISYSQLQQALEH